MSIHCLERPSKTILIVDTDKDTLETLSMLYEILGTRVLTAMNRNDAINTSIKENPDILLSEIVMPECSGFGIVRKIRQQGLNPVVVVHTGYVNLHAAQLAKENNIDYFISKPADNELLERVPYLVPQNRLVILSEPFKTMVDGATTHSGRYFKMD